MKLPALLGNYDRKTNRPTDLPTQCAIGKLPFQKYKYNYNKPPINYIIATVILKEPVFSADLPQRVPYGVHGKWFKNI